MDFYLIIIMPLDEKSEEWLREYSQRYPWVQGIIEKYGLELSPYDFGFESTRALRIDKINIANLIEDVHFLKTFDEYVRARLPQNFSSVLEVGTGNWTYAFALVTFFRKYNPRASIIGIDNDPLFVNESIEGVQSRNVKGVEAVLGDINYWQGKYDIVVSICQNLTNDRHIFGPRGLTPAWDFFYNIWRSVSENGLFIIGLGFTSAGEMDAKRALTPFFKDIISNTNGYKCGKSTYPIELLMTAKPKLPAELT